jgi:hypothetical protein
MTYNINSKSYNPNPVREGTKRDYGETDPSLLKYLDAKFRYQGTLCKIKYFRGENVWVDRQLKSGAIDNIAIHQDIILDIIEKYEAKVEKQKAETSQNFASEYQKYRQTKLSA